jgi:hypothetical protein
MSCWLVETGASFGQPRRISKQSWVIPANHPEHKNILHTPLSAVKKLIRLKISELRSKSSCIATLRTLIATARA